MDRNARLTWDDILGWAIEHPIITAIAVVFVAIGLLSSLAERFPRLAPIVRVVGWTFAIIIGASVLFFWIVPSFSEGIATRSRLENTAIVIVVLLGLILWTLWRVIEVLQRIRLSLEHRVRVDS